MHVRCRLLIVFLAIQTLFCNAQDNRTQYPPLLKKAFFGIDVGWIDYPFSNKNLPANYQAQTIVIPHTAPRLTLFGYHFTKNLSARITYMRPVQWVLYKNLNGDESKHSVWMNVGGLTIKQNIPFTNRLSVYGEAGLALITRNGFDVNSVPVISDGNYSTISAGGGVEYHVNAKWDLNFYFGYAPGKEQLNQPKTVFVGGGFTYNMHPLTVTSDKINSNRNVVFPKQVLQFSYATNKFGYGVNHFFAEGKVPVFWGGLAEVENGFSVNYSRNVFHTSKIFALDIGGSFGSWQSKVNEQNFYAFSIYPLLRFNVLRYRLADVYFFYSVAGPSFISQTQIDGHDTGKHFTFRDVMGVGSYLGHSHLVNTEISIGHFSNGNLFPNNAAVKIPLSFSLGYAF